MRARVATLMLAAALAGCGDADRAPTFGGPEKIVDVRPDTPGNNLLFRFEDDDAVETFASSSGRFLVHYTRDGVNAVPSADTDINDVPDFVEEVASTYDEVIATYEALGFRAPLGDEGKPDNGGDGRFDVYLVDFAGSGDGNFQNDFCSTSNPEICGGFMIQENDFTGYGYPSTLVANRILASHEFFHAVQAAYDNGQGNVLSEGTAVWATEMFDPSLDDFEYFIDGFFDNPDRPLDVPLPGPVDPFSYGMAIFFKFLEENYGSSMIRELWERVENGSGTDPYWLTELDKLLADDHSSSFDEAMIEFATWNLFTGSLADPDRSYVNGGDYPAVVMETASAPYVDDHLRVYYASSQYFQFYPSSRPSMTAALIAPPDAPEELDGLTLLLAVKRGGAYEVVEQLDDPSAGTHEVDTTDAERLVVVVVNGRLEDPSRKPAFCVGTADEVQACRASLEFPGSGGSGGAGGAGGATSTSVSTTGAGGGSGGAEDSSSGSNESPDDSGGCGCRTTPVENGHGILALVAGLGFLRRRRR